LTHEYGDAVLLPHALRLGGAGRRIDRVLRDDLDLAAHHAAGPVDLLLGHADAELRIGAKRAEESGKRREMTDSDLVALAAHDGRESKGRHTGQGGTGFQDTSAIVPGRHQYPLRFPSRGGTRGRNGRNGYLPVCDIVKGVFLLLNDRWGLASVNGQS